MRLDSSLERDLGIDSLARVELLMRIERAFDVRLPEQLLSAAETPRDLLRAVLQGTQRAAEAPAVEPILQALPATATEPAGTPESATTLAEVLAWRVRAHPDRTHVVVLPDGETGEPWSHAQVRDEARQVAEGLAARGIGAGACVAIMLPTGRDFFRAFLGIVLAGAVPVPIYPPAQASQVVELVRRQARILANCSATLLVTIPEARTVARMLRSLAPSLAGIATVDDLARDAAGAPLPALRPADLALLQYTSGSTGDPKGVMLTHANLLANIRAMGRAVRASSDDVFVSWLPLYHDMGLIGAWLGGLYYGFPLVVMPPGAFLNRPSRWLRAVHRYRGTLSSGPNFAYEICASRVDEREFEGLDLSSWRLAFNGAEPVSAETLERFARRFERFGFRREALAPVYGLAECAVGLAFPPLERGPRIDRVERSALLLAGEARIAREGDAAALRIVGCGAALPGYEIRVAGPDGREVSERFEGRVEFRGPSATAGYFRNPAKTRELFDGDWLDTGDLGYVAGGELFVTARAKDVIIRGGQHVHPYDIEEAVGNVSGVRKGCVAVFGVPDRVTGTEKVVVLAETRLPPGAQHDALREAVATAAFAVLGNPVDEVVLAPPHTVLKTSSGKIRRAASRQIYEGRFARHSRSGAWRGLVAFGVSLAAGRVRRGARALLHTLYGGYAWTLAALLGSAAFVACLVLPDRARWQALRALARALVRGSGSPVSVTGLERIPAHGPAVIVVNHASYVDAPLLCAVLPRPVRFVAKGELARHPLLRFALQRAGAHFVERFDAAQGAEAVRLLAGRARAGEALVFFAEGTFTRAPGLRAFHMGAFQVAAEARAPVVPLSVRGTRSILRDGVWMPRRGAVTLTVDAPLHAKDADWSAEVELRDAVRARILAACGEPDLASSA